jgi:peptide/nickel transport system substrate-binding protein
VARPRGRRARRLIAGLLGLALIASACSGGDDDDSDASAGGGDGGTSSGEPTGDLVVAVPSLGALNFTPSQANQEAEIITGMVGDHLVRLDPETRELVPGLAESWELSDDGQTWDFKLRPDIPFQDDWGTVTSEDVKFTWEQYIAEDSAHSIMPAMSQAVDGDIANFEIVSDLEFKLHTTQPIVHLPALLANNLPGMPVWSKKYFDEEGAAANEHPIGTGPWKFVSATPGVEVKLEAVPDHWRQTPAFKNLTIKEIPDAAARLAQLQSGAVDIAPLDPELAPEAEGGGDLQIVGVPDIGSAMVVLGGQYTGDPNEDVDSPWIQADDPEKGLAIRQAMSLAIDREAILDRIMNGEGTLTYGPLVQYSNNPNLVDDSWDLPEFDLDAAKEKLAEGGYPDGFEVNMPIFDQEIGTLSMGEAVAGMWEDLGLEVNRQPTEQALMRPQFQAKTTDGLAYVFVTPFYAEAALALPNAYMATGNNKQFFDPAIDEAYEKLSAEPDQDARYELTRGLIESLMDNMRAIPMFSINQPYGVGSKVDSWTPTPGLNLISNLETATAG